MHTIASGAKAVFTNEALRGMEIMRRAAGGHGFLMASGLPGVIQEFSPTPTYEGKFLLKFRLKHNFILTSGKILVKIIERFTKRKAIGSDCYVFVINKQSKAICP